MTVAAPIGSRFGRLVALREVRRGRARALECRCDCGTTKTINLLSVVRGATRSCGCLRRETNEATLAARRARAPSAADRFWSKVQKGSGCWLWSGHRNSRGYGAFAVKLPDGRWWTVRANRMAWELTRGPIQDELIVCHRCDNPPCVNPAHLFLGTHLDNAVDRESKGRGNPVRGDEHPFAKVTSAQVQEIRALVAGGACQRAVAERFGITQGIVSGIVAGKGWAHVQKAAKSVTVTDELKPRYPKGEDRPTAVLTDAKVREIRSAVAAGALHTEVARRFGICRPLVSMIVARKRWAHVA